MASVLEKMAAKQLKDNSLSQELNELHRVMSQVGKPFNKKAMAQASSFLTWLVFGTKSINTNSNSPMTEEYRQELLQDEQIKAIINKLQLYASQASSLGQNFNLALKSGNKSEAQRIGAIYYKRGIETEEGLVNLLNQIIEKNSGTLLEQTGGKQATVVLPKWLQRVLEENNKEILNELKKQNNINPGTNRQLQYTPKSAKIDIYGSEISYDISDSSISSYINSAYNILASASVKSVENLENIHLEQVQFEKAFSALYNWLQKNGKNRGMSLKNFKTLLTNYYSQGIASGELVKHLNHLIGVYALTGVGQQSIDKNYNFNAGAKYLVVVDNIGRQIIVKSTNELIQQKILKRNYKRNLVANQKINIT